MAIKFELGTDVDGWGNEVPALGFYYMNVFITDPTRQRLRDFGKITPRILKRYGITYEEVSALLCANEAILAKFYRDCAIIAEAMS